jgi:hypothetical protein
MGRLSKHSPTCLRVLWQGQRCRLDVGFLRRELPHLLRGASVDRRELAAALDFAAHITPLAVPKETKDEGRAPDRRAMIVARWLARAYPKLTGLEPTFAGKIGTEADGQVYGPFLDFVHLIFEAMNIKHDPLSFAARAAYALRGKGRKK